MADTPRQRAAKFNAAARAQAKQLTRVQQDTLKEIVRQLRVAERNVLAALQANPTDSAQRRLRELQQEIENALEAFRQAATTAATQGADQAWASALNSLRAPLAASGVEVATVGLGPARINPDLLMAAKRLMTDRIKDLSTATANRLNGVLMQHLIGSQPLSDTVTAVQRILRGATRSRAMTVAYTEIGRTYSVAHQAAMERDSALVPNLHKRWLKSGKLHPRAAHVEADGQIVAWNEPFIVDGEALMYPRDPNGSAGNTINCGCHSIPVVDGSSFDDKRTVHIAPTGEVSITGD